MSTTPRRIGTSRKNHIARRVRSNPSPEPQELVRNIVNGYNTILTSIDKVGCSDKFLALTGPIKDPGSLTFSSSLMEAMISSIINNDRIEFRGAEYLALVYVYERFLRSAAEASKKKKPELLHLADLCAWIRLCRGAKKGYLDGGGITEVLMASRSHSGSVFPIGSTNSLRSIWKKRPMSLLPLLHPLVLAPEIMAVRTEIADNLTTWSEQWENMWQKLSKLGIELPDSFPLLDKDIGYPFVFEGLIGPYTARKVCDLSTLFIYLASKDMPLSIWVTCKMLLTTLSYIASRDNRIINTIRSIEEWSVREDASSLKKITQAAEDLAPLSTKRKSLSDMLQTEMKINLPNMIIDLVFNLARALIRVAYDSEKILPIRPYAVAIAEIHAYATGFVSYQKEWKDAYKEAEDKLVGVIATAVHEF